jgi:N-acetylglucosaminyl-diphospho-decaprenol L-rhamnosyltransferase
VLAPFLESVDDATAESPVVVVADNRSGTADSVETEALAHGAEYVPMGRNAGYGAAANAGVKTLPPTVEWVLISNPDVVLHDLALDLLVATAESDPAIGAVGPAVFTAAGDLYPSARSVPSLRTGVGHALFANLWISNPWTAAYRNDQDTDRRRRDAGWLSGACLLVRRTVFDQLGGFDEGYFMYFEDVDLGYRIGRAGFRNVYEPGAEVTHSGAHSTSEHSGAMMRAHHASAQRFLASKYSGALLWPVRTALTIGLWFRSRSVRGRLG